MKDNRFNGKWIIVVISQSTHMPSSKRCIIATCSMSVNEKIPSHTFIPANLINTYSINSYSVIIYIFKSNYSLKSAHFLSKYKLSWVLFFSEGRTGHEIDRRIGAAAAVMQSLYRSVVVKRFTFLPSPMAMNFGS